MSISGRNSTPRVSMSASTNSFSALKSPGPPKSRSERLERQTNFKVVIRVRPPLPRELNGDIPFENIIAIDDREQCITVSKNVDQVIDEDGQVVANPGPYSTHSFVFDYVYGQNSTQKKVYETTARSVVDSALQGYNATIFAYGQTGTGKTYTMEGFNREGSVEARGIIPRAIEQIFGHIQRHASPRMRFLVRASYLQIYNEQISDLLKPERNNLTIREDKKKGVFVDQLSEWVVRSPAEIYGLMERGGAVRATGETKMNEISSRSHAVFIVIAEQSETVYVDDRGVEMSPEEFQKFMHQRGVRREQEMSKLEDHVRQSFKVGKLNLVDLAGSERVRLSGATGVRLEECKQINSSLSHLGFVISALTDPKNRQHIPYRNSKLTRMLEDSLGGNCKTTMMAMISPAFESMLETISTLKFANRAKNIRNEARVNEDLDQKSLLRKYERELKQLRAELEERSKNVVDKRKLLELDDMRRRAEADKMAAIRELEKRSQEFMREKEEKKKLEVRIASLMGQMIRGDRHHGDFEGHGAGAAVNGEAEIMMKEQQDQLRQEYESKLAGLERERETIEEEKAQVDRYKQLLLKQRDIMIALTQRLVERDEQIISLQDELDAYDRHHKELEEKLDEKTALLIKYERISMEASENSPFKNVEINRDRGGSENSWNRNNAERTGATELIAEDDESTAANSASVSPVPGGGAASDEKVKSLNTVVNNQRMQIANLELQVEENKMNAGKLEINLQNELENQLRMIQFDPARSQLREPLVAIVNQVIRKMNNGTTNSSGASPSPSANNDKEIQALKNENAALKAQNRQLESRSRESPADSGVLQSKCETLIKDRDAVQTILEHKIKVLVQSVAQGANAMVNSTPGGSASGIGQALSKDVAALQRLVNASIAALRNAAATTSLDSPSPQPAASSSSAGNSGTVSANGSGKFSTPAYGGSGGIASSNNSSSSGSGDPTANGIGYGSTGSGFNRVPIATPGYRGPMSGLNNATSTVGGNNNIVNTSGGYGGSGRY